MGNLAVGAGHPQAFGRLRRGAALEAATALGSFCNHWTPRRNQIFIVRGGPFRNPAGLRLPPCWILDGYDSPYGRTIPVHFAGIRGVLLGGV